MQFGRKIDSHHGLDDGERQVLPLCVGDRLDPETAFKRIADLAQSNLVQRILIQFVGGLSLVGIGMGRANIRVQLQPQVFQRVGRVIVIRDRLTTADPPVLVVQFHIDFIVDLLLPVIVAGGSGGRANRTWRRQHLVQLTKPIPLPAAMTSNPYLAMVRFVIN